MTDGSSQSSKGTFLVVDDEPEILDAIARLFRREYHVLTAQSVEEAWEFIDDYDVEVVMTDQRMPRMSGIEFLSELRESHPHIVRVLFTGYSNINDVIDAINEGHVYRYISKPWKPVELRLFVSQAFEYYRSKRERDELLERLQEANEKLEHQNALLSAANEELKLVDRVKDVFMEVVSHELNTPIAIVVGYTYLLRRELGDQLPSVAQKALAGIDSSAMRLQNISERIFKMLDEEGSGPTLNLEWLEVDKFVGSLRDQVEPFLERRNQTLEINIGSEVDKVMADEDKLTDLCLNLLMNAIKFSYDDQTIHLDIEHRDDGDELAVTVRDSGVGIADEDVSQIFDAFFSTFSSGHHSSGEFEFNKRGIGIGLAVARRFAEMHGGHIQVDSEEGQGSHFTVVVPTEPDQTEVATFPSQSTAQQQHAPH